MPNLILSLTNGIVLAPRAGEALGSVLGVETPGAVVIPSGQLVKVPTSQVKFRAGGLVAVDAGIRVPKGIYSATVDFVWGASDLVSQISVGFFTGASFLPFNGASAIDSEGSYTVLFSVESPTTVFALARQNSGSPKALTALFSVHKVG